MRIFKILILIAIIIAPIYGHSQSAEAIVERYVKFIGGQKKWELVKSLTTSGTYDYGGIQFPFTTYEKAPNLYKFIVPLNGKFYAQAYDGTKGWKIDAFKNQTKPTLLHGGAARCLANEADTELESPFIKYSHKGHDISFELDTVFNNTIVSKLKLTRRDGPIEFYYFIKGTGELIMKQSVAKNDELGGAWLTTLYSNYQETDGIKMPFKIVHQVNTQMILTVVVEKATVNAVVDDKEFQF